jgi:mycothiol synthase
MSNKSIIMRPYSVESDLQLLVDLIDTCERVDRLETFVSIDQLRSSITNPAIDRERDLSLWEDNRGQLIGFGELSIDELIADNLANGTLWFFVRPTARDGDVNRQIIDWAERRMIEVGQERQGQPKLFTWSRHTRTDRIATIEKYGFVAGRQYWFLSQSLNQTIPTSQLPEGFSIRAVDGEREAQA